MTLERRLREQFDAAGQQLPEPDDRLDRVVRRGRRRRALTNATVGLAAVVVVMGAGAGWRAVTTTRVAFEPGATPSAVSSDPASPAPTASPIAPPTPADEPSPASTQRPDPQTTVGLADLDAPVLTYNPGAPKLTLHRSGERVEVWSGTVGHVVAHQGGVVIQSGRRLVWISEVNAPQPVTIVEANTTVTLRGMLRDGRALYSTIEEPPDPDDAEGTLEHFFAVPLAVDGEPELFADENAHEAWTVGPAATASGDLVMASCHMLCNLYSWPDPSPDPLYNGGGDKAGSSAAIDAIDATPDGDVVALAEYVPAEGIRPPEVALLDGTSLRELARISLPVDALVSRFSISISADGQRVLAVLHPYAAGGEGGEGVSLPAESFLIDGALSDAPRIRRLDFAGVVQWFR